MSAETMGKLPTKDADVSWFLASNPTIKGGTQTDADGYFHINVKV